MSSGPRPGFNRWLLALALPVCAALISCAGGASLRYERLGGKAADADYLSAIATIKRDSGKLYGGNTSFLYNMDLGVLYHYAGLHDSSNRYLLNAVAVFDNLFARSITREGASLLINDNLRPYRSRPYELVLCHQFIALNFLAKGQVDEALVESRQVDLLMQELRRKDRERYSTDGMFHYLSSIAYDAAGEYDNAMISLYQAVAAFKRGPIPLPRRIENYAAYMLRKNDRAEDVRRLEIASDVPPQEIPGLGNGLSEIVFIGYAGRGPRLIEEQWWGTYIKDGLLILQHTGAHGEKETLTLPAPPLIGGDAQARQRAEKTRSGTTFHVAFALPEVKQPPSETSLFTLTGTALEKPLSTIVINDLPAQLRKNLADNRRTLITRTVIRVVLRTIAAEKVKKEMRVSNAAANLLINVGTDLFTDQLEHADTRNCFLVPATVHIARIPVKPGTYSLEAVARKNDGARLESKRFDSVTVRAGEKKFIFFSRTR